MWVNIPHMDGMGYKVIKVYIYIYSDVPSPSNSGIFPDLLRFPNLKHNAGGDCYFYQQGEVGVGEKFLQLIRES